MPILAAAGIQSPFSASTPLWQLRAYPNNPAALNEGAGEMKEGDVIVRGLVPAHQDAPEEPAVGALHAPGLEPRLVGCHSQLSAFCQGNPLPMSSVGPVHRQTHRNALSRNRLLDAIFASVSGVGAGFSPRPGARSWRRPCANSSPVPSIRHSVHATIPGTPRRQPIPESRWAVDPEQMPVAFPLATGAQDVAVGAGPVREGRPPPRGMGIPRWGRSGASAFQSSSDWKEPVVGLVGVPGRRGVVTSFPKFSRSSATFPIHSHWLVGAFPIGLFARAQSWVLTAPDKGHCSLC